MRPSIEIDIHSPRTLAEKHEGRAIFELLGQYAPNLVPEKYDLVEPIRKVFTLDDLNTVLEDWTSAFFWKKKSPKSEGSAWPNVGKRLKHGGIRTTVYQYSKVIQETVEFFKHCSAYVEADYASIHLITEREVERGKANGTFHFNNVQHTDYSHIVTTFILEKYLPDVYWGMVLGRPYVKLFGRERILSSPAAHVEELAENIFYIQLTDDIRDLETRFDDVEKVRQAVKEHLNNNAFFDESLGANHSYNVPFFDMNGRNTGEPDEVVDESVSDEELLSKAVMPHAVELLREFGTFDPFAATVKPDRSVGLVAFAAGPDEIAGLMRDAFRGFIEQDGLRAVAICADAKGVVNPATNKETDAIQVIYEDATGLAYTFFLPYSRDESGELSGSEGFSVTREPVLFVQG